MMTGKILEAVKYVFNDITVKCIISGRPPYPLVSELNEDELEYLTQHLDNYQAGKSSDGESDLGEIIGFLREFQEQQESGKTDFKLPNQ